MADIRKSVSILTLDAARSGSGAVRAIGLIPFDQRRRSSKKGIRRAFSSHDSLLTGRSGPLCHWLPSSVLAIGRRGIPGILHVRLPAPNFVFVGERVPNSLPLTLLVVPGLYSLFGNGL